MDHPRRPKIIEFPENAYIVKNQPVFLTCKAANAAKIRFKCNGDWVDGKTYHLPIHPYIETRIQIQRREVEEYFGKDGFLCECYVYSNSYSDSEEVFVKSETIKVEIANIRKHFEREPVSERKILGSVIHLPCMPPEGEPKPEVFWLKNDKELEPRSDKNVIIAHDGSLIIAIGRLVDSGNYTCGARNLAGQRLSQTVTIIVYVDGKWSDWSSWSNHNCIFDCTQRKTGLLLSWQARRRGCSKPAPANGGNFCEGESEQIKPCPTVCSTTRDPRAEWSSWSKCNEECRQYRYRSCSAEKPCDGFSKVHRMCPFKDCLSVHTIATPNELENFWGVKTVMIAGLGAAIFVFLLAALVLVSFLLRRKSRCQKHKNHWSSNGTATNGSEPGSELLYDFPDSLASNNSHQALLTDLPHSCAVYYPDTPEYDEYDIMDRPEANYGQCKLIKTLSCVGISMKVGFEGGNMKLLDTGIRLTIPYGAIDPEETVEIFLSITDDSPSALTVLSPTVTCRPSNIIFRKPVILIVPHCAGDIDQWRLSLYEKQTDSWLLSTVIGSETLNTQCYCQVDQNYVYVMTEHLCTFALMGDTVAENMKPSKRIRSLHVAHETCSRLYLVADIPANVNFVLAKEKNFISSQNLLTIFDSTEKIYMDSSADEIPCEHLWQSLSFGYVINLLSKEFKFQSGQKCFTYDSFQAKNEFQEGPERSTMCIVLPQETMEKLASLLNPPTKTGNDWRMLAKFLETDQYLPYFASRTSPTELILHLWEARTKSFENLKLLWKIFYSMERLDACCVLNVVLEN